jgi:hypothetical protein
LPVVSLIAPMRYHRPNGGGITQYGVGEYTFTVSDAYNWWPMLHMRDGQPELDSVQITDPGPPPVLISVHHDL